MSDNNLREEGFWKNLERTWLFWIVLGWFSGLATVAWMMEINHVPEICKHLYF